MENKDISRQNVPTTTVPGRGPAHLQLRLLRQHCSGVAYRCGHADLMRTVLDVWTGCFHFTQLRWRLG